MLIVIASAVLVGGGLALYIFKDVKKDNQTIKEGYEMASAFQIGVFTNYDNATRVATRNNGIVVNDNDVYRVYVALLNDQEAIEKVSNYYDTIGLNYYLKEVQVTTSFIDEINTYEEMIKKSNSDTYSIINLDVLNKYEATI